MAIYHVSISFPADSQLPRDRITIHPHFFGDNAQGLANALKTNLQAIPEITTLKPFDIKVYDAQKPPPNYPLATASQAGTTPNASVARELALCLSYYSTYNRPRYRGRLYIPSIFLTGSVGSRPSTPQITQAMAWGGAMGRNLPAQHNWVVYSPTDNQSHGVTNYWVDDEWDIVRSRGLRGTTRQLGTIP